MGFVQAIGVATGLMACMAGAQAPNTVAKNHPNVQTMSVNGTYYVLPVPLADVQKAVAPSKLLPVPTSNKDLFPNGFPAGTHPVLVRQAYGNDIRQTVAGVPLFIQALLTAEASVPYIDALNDGKTPFTQSLGNFIGGVNGQDINALVPSLVGSAEGNSIYVSTFDPNDRAYSILDSGAYSSSVKQVIVPNPVSGPGVYPDVFDTQFSAPAAPGTNSHLFHTLLNFPIVIKTQPGKCQRTTYYFNDTFANPQLGSGRVTLYSGVLPASLTSGASSGKQFNGVMAYAATGQLIGNTAENCADASKNVDPFAKQ